MKDVNWEEINKYLDEYFAYTGDLSANTTAEKRKERAIKALQDMYIYKPYIQGFKNGKVCYYENFGGYWVYQEPEVEAVMKRLEKAYNCTVYAITHEYTNFGEMWSFMFVPDYEDEWEYVACEWPDKNLVYNAEAFVLNVTDPRFSEIGDITVESFGGGLRRVA